MKPQLTKYSVVLIRPNAISYYYFYSAEEMRTFVKERRLDKRVSAIRVFKTSHEEVQVR